MPGVIRISTATSSRAARRARAPVDPRLSTLLQRAALAGLAAVLALPAARGYSPWLGWMPLWLLGMPLAALWALHGFRLPRRAATAVLARRRRRPQARRRLPRGFAPRLARAA